MTKMIFLSLLTVIALPFVAVADVDVRTVPVTVKELSTALRETPMSSEKHIVLIERSYRSHSLSVNRSYYTRLLKANPNDKYAKLWLGCCLTRQIDGINRG